MDSRTTCDERLVPSHVDGSTNEVGDDSPECHAGSATAEKPYSEYWTLMRGHGAKGPSSASKSCPKCGAPLNVTMAGECSHCRAHVTSGEFDWVLSRIEQPEAYG